MIEQEALSTDCYSFILCDFRLEASCVLSDWDLDYYRFANRTWNKTVMIQIRTYI